MSHPLPRAPEPPGGVRSSRGAPDREASLESEFKFWGKEEDAWVSGTVASTWLDPPLCRLHRHILERRHAERVGPCHCPRSGGLLTPVQEGAQSGQRGCLVQGQRPRAVSPEGQRLALSTGPF